MKNRVSLRVKLTLVVVLLVAGLAVFSTLSTYRLLRTDMAQMERLRILSDLRLTLLYLDLKTKGDWRRQGDTLYKGDVRFASDSADLEDVKSYLPPNIKFTFGIGEPPKLPEQEYSYSTTFGFIRYILDLTIKNKRSRAEFSTLKEVVFPANNEVLMNLTDSDGYPVGWIGIKNDDGLNLSIHREFIQTFVVVSSLSILSILAVLYFVVFRISAPIDLLVQRNKSISKKNKELHYLSRTDHLTGLLNRRGLAEIVKNEVEGLIASGETVSLILLDIDDFKHINDTWGHDCGDYVLFELGKLINSSVRDRDTSVRWGGEEFLILFPGLEEVQVKEAAERLRLSIEKHYFVYEGTKIPVSVTIGAVRCSQDCTFEKSLNKADKALYYGKTHGKNRTCCFSELGV